MAWRRPLLNIAWLSVLNSGINMESKQICIQVESGRGPDPSLWQSAGLCDAVAMLNQAALAQARCAQHVSRTISTETRLAAVAVL